MHPVQHDFRRPVPPGRNIPRHRFFCHPCQTKVKNLQDMQTGVEKVDKENDFPGELELGPHECPEIYFPGNPLNFIGSIENRK